MDLSTTASGATKNKPARKAVDQSSSGNDAEISTLKSALQEQRRAVTLLVAEAELQREAREALEAQLIEANAEIIASWDRRKEMARLLSEQQSKIEGLSKQDELISSLKQVIANRDQAIAKRDHILAERAKVIANRDEKISGLKAELKARYEELAALQRHMLGFSFSSKAKRLAGKAGRLISKG